MFNYIDLHCDTLMQAFLAGVNDIYEMPKTMIDIKRLKVGGCMAQFFAIFMPPLSYRAKLGDACPSDEVYISALNATMHNTIANHSDELALATNAAELSANSSEGKISAFLTLEDGRAVDSKPENLERFYKLGVRLVSLTWNDANCFGAPNSKDPQLMEQGLTDFGKSAVEQMNGLGMLIDVSHLSDGGFRDVAEISKKPFIASHSNCRELSPHSRNLTDDMIRTLAEQGGIIGLNFEPRFLSEDITSKTSRVDDMVRHLCHLRRVGGIDCIAIGSDMDGITGEFEIGSADLMQQLFDRLSSEGFTADELERIAYKNAQRVISEVL